MDGTIKNHGKSFSCNDGLNRHDNQTEGLYQGYGDDTNEEFGEEQYHSGSEISLQRFHAYLQQKRQVV